jgi:hypothetical protein
MDRARSAVRVGERVRFTPSGAGAGPAPYEKSFSAKRTQILMSPEICKPRIDRQLQKVHVGKLYTCR